MTLAKGMSVGSVVGAAGTFEGESMSESGADCAEQLGGRGRDSNGGW